MAVIQGHNHLVAFFLLQDNQYDPNEICSHTGRTALMEAALHGNDQIAKMLLDRDDVDVNMVSGQVQYMSTHATLGICHKCNALELASSNGHAGVVKLLVERADIDVNATHSPFGYTALIEAVINMQASAVEELLKHSNIDVNIVDGNGRSALSRAKGLPDWQIGLKKERQRIIKMLEERGAVVYFC